MNAPDEREEGIFRAALALPPHERGAYLDRACAGDHELRRRVEARLQAQGHTKNSTEQPAVSAFDETVAIPFVPEPHREKPGDRIGRYELLEKIGEAGMGAVWVAERTEPFRHKVALKLIKSGMDSKKVIARFEAERQALALMDHPNIAKVLDAGTTEAGRPYFVMEYVAGIPITEYCDQHTLSTRKRLELFIQVCQAIGHAHRNGIIHCDIKPSNILVSFPKGERVPASKVIDFGIAKAAWGQVHADKPVHTAIGEFWGTPAYISPEQAEMSGLDIDKRSDIYSLGVLLYELLTGQTPFDAARLQQAGLSGIRRIIREEEPPRPATKLSALDAKDQTRVAKRRQTEPPKLLQMVRGDLDCIALRTLEKDRTRRYETAENLAMDVQRHLNNQPIEAGPRRTLDRVQKWARRNKKTLTAAGFAASVTLLALLLLRALPNASPKQVPQRNVLDLVYSGAPPPAPRETPAPRLEFEIQAKRQGAADFSRLRDGDTLAAEADYYRLVAHALSKGYLYVFQLDAVGKTQWLFPQNDGCKFSSGTNPVKPDQALQMPSADKAPFTLDRTVGSEHVYAIFSANRWPELEASLSKPSQPLIRSGSTVVLVEEANRSQSRGIEEVDGPLRASGALLVIERWFRHVNAQ